MSVMSTNCCAGGLPALAKVNLDLLHLRVAIFAHPLASCLRIFAGLFPSLTGIHKPIAASADLPNLPALLRLDGQRAGCAVAVIPTNELSLMSDIVPFSTAMTGASSLSDQL